MNRTIVAFCLLAVGAYGLAQEADPIGQEVIDKSLINDLPTEERSAFPPLAEKGGRFRIKVEDSNVYVIDTTTGQVWWGHIGNAEWRAFPPLPIVPSPRSRTETPR